MKMEHHHQEEESEAWLVSYADMVTLLLGFFVMLYSFAKTDENKFREMSEHLSEYFRSKTSKAVAVNPGAGGSDRNLQTIDRIIELSEFNGSRREFSEMIEKLEQNDQILRTAEDRINGKDIGQLKLYSTQIDKLKSASSANDQVLRIMIPNRIVFASGGTDLSNTAILSLRSIAAKLRPMNGLLEVEVVAHTDSVPLSGKGVFKENFSLSAARAGAVAQVLLDSGLRKNLVTVRGKADLDPLLPERNESGRLIQENMEKNRRVEIIVRRTPPGGKP